MRTIISLVLLLLPIAGAAQSPERSVIERAFSDDDEATQRLGQLRDALESFRRLTELLRHLARSKQDPNASFGRPAVPSTARYSICAKGLDILSIGNLDWDVQTIGFMNWADRVAGHIASQRRDIAQLRLDNARLKGASPEELDKLKGDLAKAQSRYEDAVAREMKKVE